MKTNLVGAHVSIAGGLSKAIERAKNIGANCIQIFSSSPGRWNPPDHSISEIQRFNHLAKSERISPIFIHAKYLINLASNDPLLLTKSIGSLVADMNFASQVGATGVIVHLGSHQGRGFDSMKQTLAESIEKVLRHVPPDVKLIIENSAGQKGKIASSIVEISEIMSQIMCSSTKKRAKRFGICLDTCHLWAAGYDIGNRRKLDDLVDQMRKLGLLNQVVVLHVNDSRDELGSGRDRHDNLGQGKIGLTGLTTFVDHPEFRHLPKIIETPGFEGKGPDERNIMVLNKTLHKSKGF